MVCTIKQVPCKQWERAETQDLTHTTRSKTQTVLKFVGFVASRIFFNSKGDLFIVIEFTSEIGRKVLVHPVLEFIEFLYKKDTGAPRVHN